MEGDPGSTAGRLADLARRAERSDDASTARRRIELVLDEGSFTEIDALHGPADDVVAGYGTVDGRLVCAYGRGGGRLSDADGRRMLTIIDHAMTVGAPLLGIHDGAGPRLDQGLPPLARYGEVLRRSVHASGVIPQISMVMGPITGADAQVAALADFVIMVDAEAYVALHDLETLAVVSGEDLSPGDLGAAASGMVHRLADDEQDAREQVRRLLAYLPQNNLDDPPTVEPGQGEEEITDLDRELDELIPDSPHQPYDIRTVVTGVLDDGELFEIAAAFAPNIICGLGRVDGHSVGVVANQPRELAGCLDSDAARKAARFVRTCDAFNLPVLTVVDAPGFVPTMDEEQAGIASHTAKLIFAYAEATVPLITVTTRAAYGSAYLTMAPKHLGADVSLAWPTARIVVADAQATVAALCADELAADDDPEARRAELIAAHQDQAETPYPAAELGYLDAVIPPHRTRLAVASALRLLRTKRAALPPKKHGTMPL